MLINFLLTGIRNLRKNKMTSLFNIIGLSMGIACTLVILIFIEFQYKVDSIHKDGDRVFLLTYKMNNNGSLLTYGQAPAALGPAFKMDFPQVENMVRLKSETGAVTVKNKEALYERITFSDGDFFEVFNFPLKWGSTLALQSPAAAIISEDVAIKYFGSSNPVGEILNIKFGNNEATAYTIGGVAARFSRKASFDFDILLNYSALKSRNPDYESWTATTNATFIKTSTKGDMAKLITQSGKYLDSYNAANPGLKITQFGYAPLETLSLNSYRIRGSIVRGWGPPAGRIALLLIGFLLITISCLNYINAAIALGARRLMEIGVRKVLGSSRGFIIYQFMLENLIINFLALLAGILVAAFVLLPQFEKLLDIGLSFELDNWWTWAFFLCIMAFTTFLSGAYPSLYISRFQTVEILKGGGAPGNKKRLSKVMLSLQFIFAFIYIVASLHFIANEHYMRSRDRGYQQQDLLMVNPANKSAYNYFKDQLAKLPDVKAVATARDHIGFSNSEALVRTGDSENDIKVLELGVDSAYVRTLAINMLSGTPFDWKINAGINTVVINETMARRLNTKDPIGMQLKIGDQAYYVSAVTKDFRFNDFQSLIEPVVMTLAEPDQCNYIIVRTQPGAADKVYAQLKTLWQSVTPEVPFEGAFQEDAFQRYFNIVTGHNKIMSFSAFLALILSCMGLFSLVYLNIISRQKNYSIMKIMGAGNIDLILKVLGIYMKNLLIAIVIGFPLSMYAIKMMFGIVYKDHMPVSWIYPLCGFFILMPIYMLTVCSMVLKVIRQNPVKTLRNE
ncbi:ABC transporter permease [Chitinophaga sp. MM2321]|uniref:ABC transporter permease n=1 Tax=Chitinophaga sp. MM2321 TaxID=3137178 RepID=UPI0032D58DF9